MKIDLDHSEDDPDYPGEKILRDGDGNRIGRIERGSYGAEHLVVRNATGDEIGRIERGSYGAEHLVVRDADGDEIGRIEPDPLRAGVNVLRDAHGNRIGRSVARADHPGRSDYEWEASTGSPGSDPSHDAPETFPDADLSGGESTGARSEGVGESTSSGTGTWKGAAGCLAVAVLVAGAALASIATISRRSASQDAVQAESPITRIRQGREGPAVVVHPAGRDPIAVRVEVARTAATRERGLMYRRALDEDRGLLLVFPAPAHQLLWMRDVHLPLDMIFIRADGTIAGVVESATPGSDAPYEVSGESQYVLEVSGGFSGRNHLSVGDRVELVNVPPGLE